jgi:hypothetical protein
MSSSEALAHVGLRSPLGSLELALVDSAFRRVAHGVGTLEVDVPAGIYELQLQAGPQLEKRLISLESGQVFEDRDIRVAFPSPAPIDGTSTSHEYQQQAANDASTKVTPTFEGAAGLVLMVRNLRGSEQLRCNEKTIGALELRDSNLVPVPFFAERWTLNTEEGWATWSAHLPPGGYALRVKRREEAEQVLFDQAIWLSAGWQTLSFIPNSAQGAATEWSSMHMVELALDWSPYEQDVGLALELALWALREGRGVVPRDLLQLLLGSKFKNPILGIVGAHALLLQAEIDSDELDTVLGNLDELVPGHPDVAGLRWLAAEARSEGRIPAAGFFPETSMISWPPLLDRSYDALIRRDAHDGVTIQDGSVAERAAAQRLAAGLWTVWRPLDAPAVAARGAVGAEPLPAQPREIRQAAIDDPATKRVVSYLADVAEVRESSVPEVIEEISPEQVGVAAGLPSASVNRALSEIRDRVTAS